RRRRDAGTAGPRAGRPAVAVHTGVRRAGLVQPAKGRRGGLRRQPPVVGSCMAAGGILYGAPDPGPAAVLRLWDHRVRRQSPPGRMVLCGVGPVAVDATRRTVRWLIAAVSIRLEPDFRPHCWQLRAWSLVGLVASRRHK